MNIRVYAPMKCILCRYHACYDELPICRRCIPEFQKMITHLCPKCGRSATACQCMGSVRALFFYNRKEVKRLLYMVKYYGNKTAIDFLAELMVKANGIDPAKYDAITFVPRSKKNKNRYGYDQSKAIAKAISKRFGVPLIAPMTRLKGKPQKLLSHHQRLKNIINLFKIESLPEEIPKKLLLIDDICTTGATIEACTSLLRKELGCSTITRLVLAKTYLER